MQKGVHDSIFSEIRHLEATNVVWGYSSTLSFKTACLFQKRVEALILTFESDCIITILPLNETYTKKK